tara:strand:+ start:37 stop:729 length:693 start_codon:yes stop_codon:yes gene_type:complete
MSYVPDYTAFKAVSEKVSFILGQMPDGDPNKPYDQDFEIDFNPENPKADKAVSKVVKILYKNMIDWEPMDKGKYKMLIKEPTNNALSQIFNILDNKVISGMGWSLGESLDETMAYKKAQKFTKKLNDDALLKDLIYVANKIHDKMGTDDDVQEWLKTVITYGNEHPQQWRESLDEAAPKMTVHPDASLVSQMISNLGAMGRRATGSNVKKDITKALKVLQNLRSSIQVGR